MKDEEMFKLIVSLLNDGGKIEDSKKSYARFVCMNEVGEYHRLNGPAVIAADGSQLWYKNNKLHRTNGPAVSYPDGFVAYYENNRLHRLDGPAVITASGFKEYWVDGVQNFPTKSIVVAGVTYTTSDF